MADNIGNRRASLQNYFKQQQLCKYTAHRFIKNDTLKKEIYGPNARLCLDSYINKITSKIFVRQSEKLDTKHTKELCI